MTIIFDKLKNLNKKTHISVVGHQNPDVDSIFTSLLMINYLKFIGFKNVKLVINEEYIDEETFQICKKYIKDFNINNYKKNLDKNIILIDNSNIEQYKNYNLIGILDHHPNTIPINRYIYNRKACSSSCVLIDLLKNDEDFTIFFNDENLLLFIISGIIDCDNFRNPKTTIEDKLLILSYANRISNFNQLVNDLDKDTDTSNIDKVINNNFKYYIINNKKIKVSTIIVSKDCKNLEKNIIDNIKIKKESDCFLWSIIITNKTTFKTKIIEIYDKYIEELYYDEIISRGSNYIQMLEKRIL